MRIAEVSNRKIRRDFHNVARIIYKNDPVWVCPLDKEIEAIFNPDKNIFFNHGEATRWVLYDNSNQLIGRVAAFIDRNMAYKQYVPAGGMGFFECINSTEAAFMLFETAKIWLTERGMEAMDGPINFGETDKYWGLLVEGFTHPSYQIAYNHPYYQQLFESYGFKTFYKQEGFHLDITKPLPERFLRIAEWVSKKPGYEFLHFDWGKSENFVKDFVTVYNEAWASFKESFEPLRPEYIKKTMIKAKAILDPEFIWFAYHEGKPIAIYLMFPDVNMIFKHLNGKLDIPSLIKILVLKRRKTITRARGVLMGVIPAYQGLGIESAFIMQLVKVMERKSHYKEIEFSWVGDYNPKMRKIFISVGSVPAKHYITYRYLFDPEVEFRRLPIPEKQ
jgi:GNAT superfamily N-acetyltransferase